MNDRYRAAGRHRRQHRFSRAASGTLRVPAGRNRPLDLRSPREAHCVSTGLAPCALSPPGGRYDDDGPPGVDGEVVGRAAFDPLAQPLQSPRPDDDQRRVELVGIIDDALPGRRGDNASRLGRQARVPCQPGALVRPLERRLRVQVLCLAAAEPANTAAPVTACIRLGQTASTTARLCPRGATQGQSRAETRRSARSRSRPAAGPRLFVDYGPLGHRAREGSLCRGDGGTSVVRPTAYGESASGWQERRRGARSSLTGVCGTLSMSTRASMSSPRIPCACARAARRAHSATGAPHRADPFQTTRAVTQDHCGRRRREAT